MKFEVAEHGDWICWKPSPSGYMVIDPLELYVNEPWAQFMTPVMHWGAEPISGQLSAGEDISRQRATDTHHCPTSGIVQPHNARLQCLKGVNIDRILKGEEVYAQRKGDTCRRGIDEAEVGRIYERLSKIYR